MMTASDTTVPATERLQVQKQAASLAAVRAEVRTGMVLGLGTGTTAAFVLRELARRIREEGLTIRGVPTSDETARVAQELGIPLTDLRETPDLDIDGADEIDPRRNLTKGGGGAMTLEKCVAVAARKFVVVGDESKLVRRLAWPIPIEVLPFAGPLVLRELVRRFPGCRPAVRIRDGVTFVTDSGNQIIDLGFSAERPPPARLAAELKRITGVVEHGLFVGLRPTVYIGGDRGVKVIG